MNKNPLTFKHISANVVLPVGPPRQSTPDGPNEAHNAGEVWCSALWEVFVNLVQAHGHETAEPRMLKYVVGGLKLTPSSPTFLQARDGIISAAPLCTPRTCRWSGRALPNAAWARIRKALPRHQRL
jgi:extracellular elastinolytic metalloproteinase